jgi:hypothetical protein
LRDRVTERALALFYLEFSARALNQFRTAIDNFVMAVTSAESVVRHDATIT